MALAQWCNGFVFFLSDFSEDQRRHKVLRRATNCFKPLIYLDTGESNQDHSI